MTIYYVSSVDGSDSDDGTTWALAKATLKAGIDLATTDGDQVYVDSAHAEAPTAGVTFTFAANIQVITVNRSTGAATTGASVAGATNNVSLTFLGAKVALIYGISFSVNGTGDVSILGTDNGSYSFIYCSFITSIGSGSTIIIGTSVGNLFIRFSDCTFTVNNSSAYISTDGAIQFYDCIFNGSNLTTAFQSLGGRQKEVIFEGCDLSTYNSTLFGNNTGSTALYKLVDCKIGSAITVAVFTDPVNESNQHVFLYNCASDDTHYALAHYNAIGETTVSTGIYANDGAVYDGTNRCSWKIVTTANCSYYTPYVSPWIDCYHSGTSAITPYLEILRSGSATAYQDDEVWGEFSYQGTSGSPLAIIVDDAMALLGTPADQTTGSLDASGWTGENATSWFGKLNPTSTITPAEIGHLRARVCVGEPSITVYIDPTIRGRS